LAEEAYQDIYKGGFQNQDIMISEQLNQGTLLKSDAEQLRWFTYPSEVVEKIKGKKTSEGKDASPPLNNFNRMIPGICSIRPKAYHVASTNGHAEPNGVDGLQQTNQSSKSEESNKEKEKEKETEELSPEVLVCALKRAIPEAENMGDEDEVWEETESSDGTYPPLSIHQDIKCLLKIHFIRLPGCCWLGGRR